MTEEEPDDMGEDEDGDGPGPDDDDDDKEARARWIFTTRDVFQIMVQAHPNHSEPISRIQENLIDCGF